MTRAECGERRLPQAALTLSDHAVGPLAALVQLRLLGFKLGDRPEVGQVALVVIVDRIEVGAVVGYQSKTW